MLAGLNFKIPLPTRNDNAWANAVSNSATGQRNIFCEGIRVPTAIIRNSTVKDGSGEMTNLQRIRLFGSVLFVILAAAPTTGAQYAAKQEPPSASVAQEAPAIGKPEKKEALQPHRLWDKENRWLFAGLGAARTLDYFSTLNMRRRGRQEIFLTNGAVDNHAAFATVEAATTGVSIGASYLFHRCGHHKLERWTSFVHIGLATTGAARNYCLKTAHAGTTP